MGGSEGGKTWQDWDGRLSSDPVRLREKLGGRWLTTHFQAGDVLTFSMAMVHASLDNQSRRFRLASDSRYQRASDPANERWIGAHAMPASASRSCDGRFANCLRVPKRPGE